MDGWLLVMVRTEGEGDACDNEEMTAHTSTSFVVENTDIYQYNVDMKTLKSIVMHVITRK